MNAIRVDAVVKKFGAVEALKGVTLEIERGELFFLLGGSGCGKTTLLRCIAGLEEPTSGRVFFGDDDVTRLPTHKREAAMVFQSYALWPHLTVGQNIAFGLEERKVPKKEIKIRVEEALAMVKLEGYGERGIDQMSGGQQQRVSLARALVVKPRCLLLDEPLSNLDAQLRLEMRSEIRRIVKENGLTGVYVTHDQAEALSMADRMAVMDSGEIVQVGAPDAVYRQPISAYVAGFIGETNLLRGRAEGDSVESGRAAHSPVWGVRLESGVDIAGRVTGKTWRLEEGEGVTVSIRPEALAITKTGGILRGKIESRTYLGSVIQYGVRLAGGEFLQVTEMNPREIREPGAAEVGVDFSPEDVVILRK